MFERYQSWVFLHAVLHPKRLSVYMGLAMGAIFGSIQGLLAKSIVLGVFEGIFFGLFMGVFMAGLYGRMNKRSFSGLSSAEHRATVVKTVREGSAITDPALAPAVIQYAREVIKQWEGRMAKSGRVLMWVGPFIAAAFLINSIVKGNTLAAIIWALIGCSYVLLTRKMPRMWRKNVANARQAEAAAHALVSR